MARSRRRRKGVRPRGSVFEGQALGGKPWYIQEQSFMLSSLLHFVFLALPRAHPFWLLVSSTFARSSCSFR